MPNYASSSPVSSVSETGTLTLDALLYGVKWGGLVGTGASVSYSFPWQSGSSAYWAQDYSSANEPTAAVHYGLNSTEQSAMQAALQTWAAVANIQFNQVADNATSVGDIRIAFSSAVTGSYWGYTYVPQRSQPQGGDIWLSTTATSATDPNWSAGSYNFYSLVHEIGHALGFKHPGNYSGDEIPPFLTDSSSTAYLDSRLYTVMSYNDAPNSLWRDVTYLPNGNYQWTTYDVVPRTPMVLDIAAMQYLYGANMSYHTGDDTYTFDPATPFFETIWDAGGHDTISVSNFSQPCVIDLTPGHYSSIRIVPLPVPATYTGPNPTYDGTNNLGIAYGTIIEDAIGGAGNDTLIGNSANNMLQGRGGDDTLDGGDGIDTASYIGVRANFTLAKTATGYTVSDRTGAEGTDTLANIERLQFADQKVAIDLSGSGHAAETVEVLGAAFGKAIVSNTAAMGAGLAIFDGGWSLHDVSAFLIGIPEFKAIDGTGSNVDFVNALFRNVVGTAPSQASLASLVGLLQGSGGAMTQADFLTAVATTDINLANVNLVGLQQTGVQYT